MEGSLRQDGPERGEEERKMRKNLRWLQGAKVLLYLGPLLAGFGGYGWLTVPAFVVIFVLWIAVVRPDQMPLRSADWQGERRVSVGATVAVQVLVVVVLFGIGRGLSGMIGAMPLYSVVVPFLISLVSIPLSRLLWNAERAAELGLKIDDDLRDVVGGQAEAAEGVSVADRLVEPLLALPAATVEAEIGQHVAAMTQHAAPEALWEALLRRAQSGAMGADGRTALAAFATDPAVATALLGEGVPARALKEIQTTPEAVAVFARRCAALIERNPFVRHDCPDPASLRDLAGRLPHAGAQAALTRLADVTEKAPLA